MSRTKSTVIPTALGVDAAWSASRDSGFALMQEVGAHRCQLLAAGPSVGAFASACGLAVAGRPRAGLDAGLALESAARRLGGNLPHVVAADLPLSRELITGRRASNDAISRRFAVAGCGAHSPSAYRPGEVGRDFQSSLAAAGFRLAAAAGSVGAGSLIEVYPHPALLGLMGTARRVPYKVGKTGSYWPGRAHAERLALVRAQLWRIAERLDVVVAGTLDAFATLVEGRRTLSGLKQAEDVLDAIVSAWVGVAALAGAAEPFGDEVSAIWVPAARQMAAI
jgi:predicted RNase H-like nuclease